MKVIDLLKKIENGENIPKKIKVYQEVFEWDILEHYYKRSNGDDLLELCTIFNTGELLSMEVELIEDEIDIDSIGELKSVTNNIDGTVCIMNKIILNFLLLSLHLLLLLAVHILYISFYFLPSSSSCKT